MIQGLCAKLKHYMQVGLLDLKAVYSLCEKFKGYTVLNNEDIQTLPVHSSFYKNNIRIRRIDTDEFELTFFTPKEIFTIKSNSVIIYNTDKEIVEILDKSTFERQYSLL